ncbi:MAG TPA: T9SS type A sorting domain-containing protein, partial [Chitinophagales bacterium]|nr:T9SS type A sorting domain-containing protein [Chitinophagales bacterium]
NVTGNCRLSLVNAIGQTVKTWNALVNADEAFRIDTDGLTPGVYMLNLNNGKTSAATRLIKQ